MSDRTLSRATAEALLDGGPGPERLRYVLAAAAGPGEPDELGGEEAARLAFLAAADTWPAPGTVVDPVRARGRTLSRIVAAKAIAAVALTVGAGGVAVAATTNSFREGPFGGSSGQHSEPAPADTHRTLVVDRASGSASRDAADPTPRTTGSAEPDESSGRSGSCRDDAALDCAAPPVVAPAASPTRPTSAPIGSAPVNNAPAAPSPARPSHASASPDTTKNRPPTGNKKSKPPKPQPPGQVEKTEPAAKKSGTGKAED